MFDKLSAREFLAFTAEIYGVESEKAKRHTNELLEMFELADSTESADELVDG